jgi:hypothetical protein
MQQDHVPMSLNEEDVEIPEEIELIVEVLLNGIQDKVFLLLYSFVPRIQCKRNCAY